MKIGDEKMKMSDTWENETYEIDFEDFSIEDLTQLRSWLTVYLAINRNHYADE